MLLHSTMHLKKGKATHLLNGMAISKLQQRYTRARVRYLNVLVLPMNSQLNHSDGVIEVDTHLSDTELDPEISMLFV